MEITTLICSFVGAMLVGRLVFGMRATDFESERPEKVVGGGADRPERKHGGSVRP